MMAFFQRRGNKKKEEDRPRGLLLAAVVGISLAATLVLYLGSPRLTRWAAHLRDAFLNHAFFSVREIKVSGGGKVGGSEVVAMAGLSQGVNIWKVDPRVIEKRIAKHPWVKRVLVRREFPHRVVIEVEERAPQAIVVLAKLYYVDSEGFVFKEVGEGEEVNYLLLTGLQQSDLAASVHAIRHRIQEALKLGELMEKSSLALSEIRFSSSGGVILYPMSFPVALHMGWGEWERKLQRLERILALWKGKEHRLASLDMAFREQVVAHLRKEF